MTTQIKAVEPYFHVVLFIMQYKGALPFAQTHALYHVAVPLLRIDDFNNSPHSCKAFVTLKRSTQKHFTTFVKSGTVTPRFENVLAFIRRCLYNRHTSLRQLSELHRLNVSDALL